MKKKILACLLIVACLLGLSSCNKIDEMRAKHATRENDVITFQGEKYQTISNSLVEELYIYDQKRTIYVTEPDVPVLLSKMFGTEASINAGNTLIQANGYYGNYNYMLLDSYEYFDSQIFAREDVYDQIVESIEKNDFNNFFLRESIWSRSDSYDSKDGFLPDEMNTIMQELYETKLEVFDSVEFYGRISNEEIDYYNSDCQMVLVTDDFKAFYQDAFTLTKHYTKQNFEYGDYFYELESDSFFRNRSEITYPNTSEKDYIDLIIPKTLGDRLWKIIEENTPDYIFYD